MSVVVLVTTVTFILVHLAPGDPFSESLERPGISAEVRARWRASYGLHRPIGEQYLRWVANTARGNLGFSFSHRRPVHDVLAMVKPHMDGAGWLKLAAGAGISPSAGA